MPLAVLVFLASALAAQTHRIAGSAAEPLVLEVDKTGLMRGKTHVFHFTAYTGTATLDPPSVELTIRAAEFDVKDSWLSAKDAAKVRRHALDEMLDAARHPEMRFRSTRATRRPGGWDLEGELTIRGRARPVTLRITEAGPLAYDIAASFLLTSFSLNPPSAVLGAVGTKDEVRLSGRVTLR